MRLLLRASLTALLFATGCGGAGLGLGITDGGPVGTGITTSVVGNVVTVEDLDGAFGAVEDVASAASAESGDDPATIASVDGIEVSIVEFPDSATTTDADGNFNLEGDFDGALTIRFRTPELELEQPVELPSGGILVLSDIELNRDGVIAEATQQLELVGKVRSVDCEAGRILVEDRRNTRFEVTLIDETRFVRENSTTSCAQLRDRDDIEIKGLQDDVARADITALVVELHPRTDLPRPVEPGVAFLGNIAALDCRNGRVLLHDGRNRIRLQISAQTRVETRQGEALRCEDLRLDLRVTGEGTLNLQRPGLIRAERLTIGPPPPPGARVPISGRIVGADCDQRILQISSVGVVTAVRITDETRIDARRDFRCEDTQRNELSARGDGVVSEVLPGGIDALRLVIRSIK